MNDQRNDNKSGNRFEFTPKPDLYSDKTEYLRALSLQLTPDLWTAIVTRAIHDATFGRSNERAKAREWFAKFLLPDRAGTELSKVSEPVHTFLAEVYNIFHGYARNTEDIEKGLGTTIGALTTEERAVLRKALVNAESEEVRKFWGDPLEGTANTDEGSSPAIR